MSLASDRATTPRHWPYQTRPIRRSANVCSGNGDALGKKKQGKKNIWKLASRIISFAELHSTGIDGISGTSERTPSLMPRT